MQTRGRRTRSNCQCVCRDHLPFCSHSSRGTRRGGRRDQRSSPGRAMPRRRERERKTIGVGDDGWEGISWRHDNAIGARTYVTHAAGPRRAYVRRDSRATRSNSRVPPPRPAGRETARACQQPCHARWHRGASSSRAAGGHGRLDPAASAVESGARKVANPCPGAWFQIAPPHQSRVLQKTSAELQMQPRQKKNFCC